MEEKNKGKKKKKEKGKARKITKVLGNTLKRVWTL